MDIQSLLLGKNDCACGMKHACDVKYVEIGNQALEKLPEICAAFSHVLLVSDGNTYPICGKKVKEILGEKIQSEMRFGCDTVVPNETAIAEIETHLTESTDLLIGVGSGVINDLCKYTSFFHGLRYVIVATAPSMDGYASVGAAMILEEMKVTVNARVPYAIVGESSVLCTAPIDMIQSGYGDILGKYSCLNDWKLSSLINGEYFCQFVFDAVMDTVHGIEGLASKLLERDPDAIAELTKALVTVGILMSYVGNSRPASGSEHHLAHYFEITGLLNRRGYFLHGIDVLYSAALTAELRERLLQLEPPFAPFRFDRSGWENAIRNTYSTAASGIIALQDKVGNYKKADTSVFAEKWKEIKTVLKEAPTFDKMISYIRAIGLDYNDYLSFYGTDLLRDAVKYAKDLKDRYTVLWPAYILLNV